MLPHQSSLKLLRKNSNRFCKSPSNIILCADSDFTQSHLTALYRVPLCRSFRVLDYAVSKESNLSTWLSFTSVLRAVLNCRFSSVITL